MAKNTTKKITSIGGSALIEGIMMRGPKRTTVCVRTAPDKIYSEDISINTIPSKCKLFKLPFLRGIAGLIDSMRLSYKALMLSADKAIESTEIEEEPSKFEKWLDDKFGDKLVKVMMVIASILGVALAVGLFFFVPSFLFDLSANVVPAFKGDGGNAVFWKSVFEGSSNCWAGRSGRWKQWRHWRCTVWVGNLPCGRRHGHYAMHCLV